MVVIRLTRGGTKNRPFYSVVVADKRSRRDGKFIERLGFYNPSPQGKDIPMNIKLDRVDHWIGCGAQLSPKVKSLVKLARKQAITLADGAQKSDAPSSI